MKKLYSRIFKYIIGLFIMTLGIGFAIESDLGAAPVSAFPYTLQVIANLDIGTGTILFQCVLVLLQLVILRKKFELKNLLQIPAGVIFGWMTGFSSNLISMIPDTDSILLRVIMVLTGSFLIALGLAFYVPADIVPLPSEGVIKVISDIKNISFSNLKIAFDCTMVILSGILCLSFTHSLKSVGIGTVILAITVGLINKQILKFFKICSSKRI